MGIVEKPSPTLDTLGDVTVAFYLYIRSNGNSNSLWNFDYCFSGFLLQRTLKPRENVMAQDNIGSLTVLVTPFSMQNIQKSLVFAIRNKGNLVTGIK